MPEIGEVRSGRDIGFTNTQRYIKFIWVACPLCGNMRWVQLKNGKARSEPCYQCRGELISRGLKGQPNPKKGTRISLGCRGEKSVRWKGGRYVLTTGYIAIYVPPDDFFYPMVDHHSHVFEHRLVMARHLKRCLLPWEIVHHKNGVKDDNRLQNLELLPARKYHLVDTVAKSRIRLLQKQVASLNEENGLLRQQVEALSAQ